MSDFELKAQTHFQPPMSSVGLRCHLYRFAQRATAAGQRWHKDLISTSSS